jgi:hypothetical protein
VDAKPLNNVKLEAVMIGNAASALQGAPVTTLDIDFMFRETPKNMEKLKSFAIETLEKTLHEKENKPGK